MSTTKIICCAPWWRGLDYRQMQRCFQDKKINYHCRGRQRSFIQRPRSHYAFSDACGDFDLNVAAFEDSTSAIPMPMIVNDRSISNSVIVASCTWCLLSTKRFEIIIAYFVDDDYKADNIDEIYNTKFFMHLSKAAGGHMNITWRYCRNITPSVMWQVAQAAWSGSQSRIIILNIDI